MIYLHTGQPGAGKTLFSLYHIKKRADSESRLVYYNGIPELQIPGWQEFPDPEKWYDLPPGAIIVIDECQRVFRPRGTGKTVPEYISRFETHRHHGHDIYLITQHPMLIDQNIRRLTGTHRHIVRTFGSKKAFVHEWNEVRTDCDRKRTDSSKTAFVYPKEVFSWYKSAEVHTHKLQLPTQVFFLLGLAVLLVALLWYLYARFNAPAEVPKAIEQQTQHQPAETKPSVMPPVEQRTAEQRPDPITPAEYAELRAPRISSLPHTAPIYDELTKPVRVPYPAACVSFKGECRCYSQQGTRLNVREDVCTTIIARGGIFLDFEPDPVAAEDAREERKEAAKAKREAEHQAKERARADERGSDRQPRGTMPVSFTE